MDTDYILKELEKKLKGKIVILGIGNPLRGDDAFGSLFADRIMGKVNLSIYNGGSSPENILGKIIQEKPDTILIVDAVDFGTNSGNMDLWEEVEDLRTLNIFFTHNLSLRMIFDFLKESTNSKIYLLAIQPKSIKFGDKISPELEEKLNLLSEWFIEKYFVKK